MSQFPSAKHVATLEPVPAGASSYPGSHSTKAFASYFVLLTRVRPPFGMVGCKQSENIVRLLKWVYQKIYMFVIIMHILNILIFSFCASDLRYEL